MAKSDASALDPQAVLRTLLSRCEPAVGRLFAAVRTAMRRRLPTANELVYDYGTFVVISYAPDEQPMHAVAAISTRDGAVSVYLMHGGDLPDPRKLLQGSGKLARYFRVAAAKELADPYVESLLAAAVARAKVPLPVSGKGRLVLRAGAAKPAGKTAGRAGAKPATAPKRASPPAAKGAAGGKRARPGRSK